MEFAIVLPLIMLMLLGAVEVGRGVMVTHSLQEAAQAGCRVYCVEDTTKKQAKKMVKTVMADAGIENYKMKFKPGKKSKVDTHLEPISVTVTVPFAEVGWLPADFLAGATLSGSCVMPADVDHSDGGDSNGYSTLDDDNDTDGFTRFSGDIDPDDDDDDDDD